jgi:hypothetical protein
MFSSPLAAAYRRKAPAGQRIIGSAAPGVACTKSQSDPEDRQSDIVLQNKTSGRIAEETRDTGAIAHAKSWTLSLARLGLAALTASAKAQDIAIAVAGPMKRGAEAAAAAITTRAALTGVGSRSWSRMTPAIRSKPWLSSRSRPSWGRSGSTKRDVLDPSYDTANTRPLSGERRPDASARQRRLRDSL